MFVSEMEYGLRVENRWSFEQGRKIVLCESKWDHDQRLLSLMMNNEEMKDILANPQNEDHDQAVQVKEDHLSQIKSYLQYKEKEKRRIPYFILHKWRDFQITPIEVEEVINHPKTIEFGLFREKKKDVFHAPITLENERLVEEYNQKLKEFLSYQAQVFGEVFGEEQVREGKVS